MPSKLRNVLSRVSKDTKRSVELSYDISGRILDILDAKGWSQKKLAEGLGKSESEISRWMKGTHNFTLETIAKIEEVLEAEIIEVAKPKIAIVHEVSIMKHIYFDEVTQGGKACEENLQSFQEMSKPTSIKLNI